MRTVPQRLLALFLLAIPSVAFGAFGLTSDSNYYTVDTGAGLVFKVRRTNPSSSTQDTGDISNLQYNGLEYSDTSRGSQQGSGAGWLFHYDLVTNGVTNTYANSVDVTATNIGTDFIKITVACALPNDPGTGTNDLLYHYYIVRKGYPHIYMATWFNTEPQPNQCRFIVRLQSSMLPNGPEPSRNRDADTTIESADIFGVSTNSTNIALRGQTRAKHYSNHRQMDWSYTGAINNQATMVGVWMVKSNHEGDSGGPFYRCLINQNGSDQEIYETVNYAEGNPEYWQTGSFRAGTLNGPYTLVFTPGTLPPAKIDTTWLTNAGFNLTGYVPDSLRGKVAGLASGVPLGFQAVVGFSNTNAQYWCIATNGAYQSPLMIPGTYTQVLYKGELEVATNNGVVVGTNATTVRNIISQEFKSPFFTWRVGEWDGSPVGFLNATKATNGAYPNDLMCTTMHPSDVRMADWAANASSTNPYIIGKSIPSQFPCYQWMGVNNGRTIQFTLTPAQAARNHTLRVGITTAYAGARPSIGVNGKWNSSLPNPSSQPGTRTMTVGTYRGLNATFSYSIPASAFVSGTNTLTLILNSGSMTAGATWLSPGVGYDCIELD